MCIFSSSRHVILLSAAHGREETLSLSRHSDCSLFFSAFLFFFCLIDYSRVSKLPIFLLSFFFAVVMQLGKYSNKAAAGGGVKMCGIPSVPLCDLEVNHFTIFSVSAYIFFTQTGKRMSVLDVSTSWTLLAFFETLFFFRPLDSNHMFCQCTDCSDKRKRKKVHLPSSLLCPTWIFLFVCLRVCLPPSGYIMGHNGEYLCRLAAQAASFQCMNAVVRSSFEYLNCGYTCAIIVGCMTTTDFIIFCAVISSSRPS